MHFGVFQYFHSVNCIVQLNIWKIIYLNCGERWEDINYHPIYTTAVTKLKKIQTWTGFKPMTSVVLVQCSINWVMFKPSGSWSPCDFFFSCFNFTAASIVHVTVMIIVFFINCIFLHFPQQIKDAKIFNWVIFDPESDRNTQILIFEVSNYRYNVT